MFKVEVRPFEMVHLDELEARQEFKSLGDHKPRIKRLIDGQNSSIETVMIGFTPSAVIGLTRIWPGVAEAWTLMSDRISSNPIGVSRAIVRSMHFHTKKMNLHRVHATVRSGYLQGERWIQILGFKPEATLAGYGPDKSDHTMYKMVMT